MYDQEQDAISLVLHRKSVDNISSGCALVRAALAGSPLISALMKDAVYDRPSEKLLSVIIEALGNSHLRLSKKCCTPNGP